MKVIFITDAIPLYIRQSMGRIKECRNIPKSKKIHGKGGPSHSISGYNEYGIQWIAFSFESVSELKQSLGFKGRIVDTII